MKKILRTLAIFALPLALVSCNYGLPFFLYGETGAEDRAKSAAILSGANLPELGSGTKYSFVVLTDSHFGNGHIGRADERFLQKFKELLQSGDESLRPRFIVNLGDALDGGRESEAVWFNATAQTWIDAGKEALGAGDYKVYSLLGNHDLYNDGWEVWKKKMYPYTSYYTFSLSQGGTRTFDFLFLDTGNGTLGGPQIEDLERLLKNSSNPKIVFMHYPLYAGGLFYFALDDVSERARLISDFARGNVKYVFEGHYHSGRDFDFKNFKEAVVGAYLEKKTFGLVTVDENDSSVAFARVEY